MTPYPLFELTCDLLCPVLYWNIWSILYHLPNIRHAWVHTLILLRFAILYMLLLHRIRRRSMVGNYRTPQLARGAGTLPEAYNLLQSPDWYSSASIWWRWQWIYNDNEYHCSIAWGHCNRWPSKFAPHNVSVVPACPIHHRLHSVNTCSLHQVCPTHHSLQDLQ